MRESFSRAILPIQYFYKMEYKRKQCNCQSLERNKTKMTDAGQYLPRGGSCKRVKPFY
jgi:hypothetical protein